MPGDATTGPEAEFLVVGAGSSGAAVAGRLAQRGRDVTLLEAGPDWRADSCLPELRYPNPDIFAWKVGGLCPPDYAWPGLEAVRHAGEAPRPYLRGRGLGGTSTINGLVVVRPPVEEFAAWPTGWRWDDVLPCFIRSEDDLDFAQAAYHGRGGPTPICRQPVTAWGTTDHLLAEAAAEAGHAWSPDHNAPHATGVSCSAMNLRHGVRVTTNDGYLEPQRERPNLRVVGDALVDRVRFDGAAATGVRARIDGTWRVIPARHVVLCAGAAASPAILQRSGIGPAALLRSLGIPVIADTPVGVGVQDHVGFWLGLGLGPAQRASTGARGNCTLRYTSGTDGFGPNDLLMISANPRSDDPTTGALGVKLAQCHSRGSLRIVDPDPEASPHIELNLLADPRDRELGRRALRDAVGLLTDTATARRSVREVTGRDGAALPDLGDDADVDAWLRRFATDTSHLSGGARIGEAGDPRAVVDPQGRVKGTQGLSVADMSIAPAVPRANTHLTAVMVGERTADLLVGPCVGDNVNNPVDPMDPLS